MATVREVVGSAYVDFDPAGLNKFNNAMNTIGKSMAGLGALWAGSKIAQALDKLVLGPTEAADALNDLSTRTGVSTDTLQEWGYAAKLSGSNAEELQQNLGILQRNLGEAANGSAEAQKKFAAMGISVGGAGAAGVTLDDVLGKVADKIAATTDANKRAAIATEAFGRGGAALVPLLSQGSASIEALRTEAHKLGGVMDADFINQSAEFNDTLDRLSFGFDGLKNTISGAMLPSLRKLTDGFLNWFMKNREIIGQRLDQVFTGIGRAIEVIADMVSFVARAFSAAFDKLSEFGGGVKTVAVGLSILAALLMFPALAAYALGAALILVLEDFKVFSEGGRSLIGRLIDKFWKMAETSDSVLVKMGAMFVTFFTELAQNGMSGVWDEWTKALFVAQDAWKKAFDDFMRYVHNLPGIKQIRSLIEWGNKNIDSNIQMVAASSSGRLASNLAPSESAVGGGTSLVNAPRMEANITVNAAPGQSAVAVGEAAVNSMDTFMQNQVRQAYKDLVPQGGR